MTTQKRLRVSAMVRILSPLVVVAALVILFSVQAGAKEGQKFQPSQQNQNQFQNQNNSIYTTPAPASNWPDKKLYNIKILNSSVIDYDVAFTKDGENVVIVMITDKSVFCAKPTIKDFVKKNIIFSNVWTAPGSNKISGIKLTIKDDIVDVICRNNDKKSIYYFRLNKDNVSNKWSIASTYDTSPFGVISISSLYIDSYLRPHIIYVDNNSGRLSHAYFNNNYGFWDYSGQAAGQDENMGEMLKDAKAQLISLQPLLIKARNLTESLKNNLLISGDDKSLDLAINLIKNIDAALTSIEAIPDIVDYAKTNYQNPDVYVKNDPLSLTKAKNMGKGVPTNINKMINDVQKLESLINGELSNLVANLMASDNPEKLVYSKLLTQAKKEIVPLKDYVKAAKPIANDLKLDIGGAETRQNLGPPVMAVGYSQVAIDNNNVYVIYKRYLDQADWNNNSYVIKGIIQTDGKIQWGYASRLNYYENNKQSPGIKYPVSGEHYNPSIFVDNDSDVYVVCGFNEQIVYLFKLGEKYLTDEHDRLDVNYGYKVDTLASNLKIKDLSRYSVATRADKIDLIYECTGSTINKRYIYYQHSSDGGVNWSGAELISTGLSNGSLWPKIISDSSDDLFLFLKKDKNVDGLVNDKVVPDVSITNPTKKISYETFTNEATIPITYTVSDNIYPASAMKVYLTVDGKKEGGDIHQSSPNESTTRAIDLSKRNGKKIKITLQAVDGGGNKEESGPIGPITVDFDPPTTEITMSQLDGGYGEWYKANPKITFDAIDEPLQPLVNSGVKTIHWAVDGEWDSDNSDTVTRTLTNDDDAHAYGILYWAEDKAGNKEITKESTVTPKVDKTEPETPVILVPALKANSITAISGTARDVVKNSKLKQYQKGGSGIAKVEVRIRKKVDNIYWYWNWQGSLWNNLGNNNDYYGGAEVWKTAPVIPGEPSDTWALSSGLPDWEDGLIYQISARATDKVGHQNSSSDYAKQDVAIDTIPPVITNVAPILDTYVKTTEVSYTLSEDCASGSVTWTRTGGQADPTSPHVQALVETELNSGPHGNIDLKNPPTLVSDAIYTVSFDATDPAGNPAKTVSTTNVTYDNTPPKIVSGALDANNAFIDIVFSEGVYKYDGQALDVDDFDFIFNKNGGTAFISKYLCTVTHTAGMATARINLTISGTPNGQETLTIKPFTQTAHIYDKAHNAATTDGVTVELNDQTPPPDAQAPTVTYALSPASPDGDNGWYKNSVTLTLTAVDLGGSGLKTVNYTLDGTPSSKNSSPVNIPITVGAHNITYWAVDNANNEGPHGQLSVKRDNVLPTGSIEINGGSGKTITNSVTLHIKAADANSGVAFMQVRNDTNWDDSWDPFNGDETINWVLPGTYGNKTVRVKFKDNAGNISSAYSDSIDYDQNTPVTPTVTGISPAVMTYGQTPTVTITGSNFVANKTEVTIGLALDVAVVNATTITAQIPSGLSVGKYDVVVTVDGQKGTLSNGFEVKAKGIDYSFNLVAGTNWISLPLKASGITTVNGLADSLLAAFTSPVEGDTLSISVFDNMTKVSKKLEANYISGNWLKDDVSDPVSVGQMFVVSTSKGFSWKVSGQTPIASEISFNFYLHTTMGNLNWASLPMSHSDITTTKLLAISIGEKVNKQEGDSLSITVRDNASQQTAKDEYVYFTSTGWLGPVNPKPLTVGQPFQVSVPRSTVSQWE